MGLHPGASIGQNVRLIRPLSRGGMGSVWRAEHLTLHTEVAVKFVSDALIGDQGFLARFTREAVASARIKSPHAVQIFDHGVTADGLPYIVMELLEGEDLRTRLLREKKLPHTDTAKVVTQVARGLSRAHKAGIVHRDIKPGNVFLMEQDGELFVKILDFGIAKQIGDLDQQVTMTGQIIGTPHYVSPEQIQTPREADPQNDLWSLAVVAYRCLTGDLPFEGESVGAVAIAIDKAAFAPVTRREPSLPAMLDAFFARAFARVPTERFASAKEMALAFEAASKGLPLEAPPSDSSLFSLRNTPETAAADVAKLAASAPDHTPGALHLEAPARTPDAVTRLDERATRPDLPAPAASSTSASPGAEKPASAPLAAQPVSPVQATETPIALGEPTLSQGTVTHIEWTQPRRTRLYGTLIAALAIGGAITVGVLSRGDDTPEHAASSGSTASTPAASSPSSLNPLGPAASDPSLAPKGASPPLPSAASAAPSADNPPAATAALPGAAPGPSAPATTTTPAPSTAPSAAPTPAKTVSAPATTSTKKKKDRGF